jgi:phage baseplate assembly protein W
MNKPIYTGYSSYNYQSSKSFKMTNIDIVEMDLLNHIFTRRGERVMMPTFGTRIPDMAFDPRRLANSISIRPARSTD